jgi:glycosyltransferase involved in cell wall biosynthesis
MKTLIIGPAYPFRGGIADTNESLCRALQQKGHEATILTFTLQYPELFFPGKTQYSADPKPENIRIEQTINSVNPLNWIKTALKINRIKPDLVIIRYWIPFMAPCLGTIARFLKKPTRIIGMTDNIVPHEKRAGDKLMTRYFIKACHGFITLSTTVNQELKSFTNKPSVYFPHPINDNLGSIMNQKEAREFLNLEPDGNYILFFGIVRKYKGLDLLLKALNRKDIIKKDIKLIIAGEFYDKPATYYNLIEQLGLKDQVIIVNKFIPGSHIKYYFSAADLVAQTYHSASQSGITQIAYHFERPMLVTNVGGLSEIIPDKKVGYVVEKDPGAIARAIRDFYENKKFGEFHTNVKEEKQKYSWAAFVDELMKLTENLNYK